MKYGKEGGSGCMKGYELCNIVIGPKMTFGIYRKISPNPCLPDRQAPFPKRGTGLLPLWKRGMEGDFSKIIFMLLCEPIGSCRFPQAKRVGNPSENQKDSGQAGMTNH